MRGRDLVRWLPSGDSADAVHRPASRALNTSFLFSLFVLVLGVVLILKYYCRYGSFFCLLLSLAFGSTHTGMKKQCGLSCYYTRKAIVGRARARALKIKSR